MRRKLKHERKKERNKQTKSRKKKNGSLYFEVTSSYNFSKV